ncbi:4-hydroxy-tetrahydrodipicolinate reductase [Candidatus Pantoea carbekii]|uniref:4-hydroxy-tetrahydrodipicolinate reductase n=1 Tax=Candidatus Pantoea carbekii TaxID=1235990 RepID=U3U805_9GAMM|nr:4-hydroxy-tetrahydrodipicolinate reductase [Candidatus Pantoea carbekii]AKC31952.1 dihydrodipicolinate reductase [Candidatus Pantoea carbekii]BAO00469.1 dihydrodipicolinate reductase [Candidatus Pantoea carbekii]
MSDIRIAISGTSGRMGRNLIAAIDQTCGVVLTTAVARQGSPLVGKDAGEFAGIDSNRVNITNDLQKAVNDFDVLIDFTCPESTLKYIKICLDYCKPIVIGTTGLDDIGKKIIHSASLKIPIVFSANFSIGVNIMFNLLKQITKVMGSYADIEIIEAHHHDKVDAPSGTALTMGEVIADTMDWKLNEHAIYGRKGYTGKRKQHTIGFSTVRAGDIIGEHTAIFAAIGERVEIIHRATNRMTFADGAIKAASWLIRQKFGLYNMHDVLNLS